MKSLAIGLCAIIFVLPSSGQTISAPPPKNGENTNVLPAVEVSGASPSGAVTENLSQKLVLTRDAIEKFGDFLLSDILSRVPGVSIVRPNGKDVEVKLRGLSSGYVQILLNGEKFPVGFSVDSISPDLIERIEITKVNSADQSAQAVTGAVNIITKKKITKNSKDYTVSVQRDTRTSANATGNFSIKTRPMSYSLSVNVKDANAPSNVRITNITNDMVNESTYMAEKIENYGIKQITVSPQVSRSINGTGSIALDGFFYHSKQDLVTDIYPTSSVDAELMREGSRTIIYRNFARQMLSFNIPLSDKGAKVDVKVGVTNATRFSDSAISLATGGNKAITTIQSFYPTNERTYIAGVKLIPYGGEAHKLMIGFDGNRVHRRDGVKSYDPSEGVEVNRSFNANVGSYSAFIQDEISISDELSAYLGFRNEQLRTRVNIGEAKDVVLNTSVLSPIFKLSYAISNSASLTVSANKSYKAPSLSDLTPRRYYYVRNSRLSPDTLGNPAVRPEVSANWDVSVQSNAYKFLELSLSAYGKRIKDVVYPILGFTDNRWVETPVNIGNASAFGLEFGVKANLKNRWTEGDRLVVDLGIGRNWSSVDYLPPPGNKLDKQIPFNMTVAVDYKFSNGKSGAGASVSYKAGTSTRASLYKDTYLSSSKSLDVYYVHRVNEREQIRTSISNLFKPSYSYYATFRDPSYFVHEDERINTFRAFRIVYDRKL